MPTVPHIEKHFMASDIVRDIVIGMSDGLTVPFALAAGISGAVSLTHIVVTAGLAEIAAGSISMGLGGYLAAKTDLEHYQSEKKREYKETEELPEQETEEVKQIFRGYGMTEENLIPVVAAIKADRSHWVDFMLRYELGLEAPNPKRAKQSAFTIALSYMIGGLVPLASYMFIPDIHRALLASVLVTLCALFVFGYLKGHFTGLNPLRGGLQTVFIGGLAATAAFLIARMIS